VVVAHNHEHGQAGFVRNLWLFSAFFTMSSTVWMEMLAKPRALARGQHRLTSVPRPLRAIRRKSQRVVRYARISRTAARHGLGRSLGISDDEAVDGRAPVPGAPVALSKTPADDPDPASPNAFLIVDGMKLIVPLVAASKAARLLTS